jgi:hypothetical protein
VGSLDRQWNLQYLLDALPFSGAAHFHRNAETGALFEQCVDCDSDVLDFDCGCRPYGSAESGDAEMAEEFALWRVE